MNRHRPLFISAVLLALNRQMVNHGTSRWSAVDGLTVYRATYRVGLGEVADTVEQLSAVTLTVLFDCVDLGHGGGRVCPEDGLTVLPTGGVTTCIAAACGAHWRNAHKHTHRLSTTINASVFVRNQLKLGVLKASIKHY